MPANLIVASNRGPLSFRTIDGEGVATRGVGGLVTAVTGALRDEEATWIAIALSDGDRERAASPAPIRDGQVTVELEALPEDQLTGYYRDASNRGIWFAAHGSGARTLPDSAWEAYRTVNRVVADRICAHAAPHATVLVHDYHLCLVPELVRAQRPDLAVSFFWHVPFPEPDDWWSLGDPIARELLHGMGAADVIGVHAHRWADQLGASFGRIDRVGRVEILGLGIDVPSLRASASSTEVDARFATLHRFDGQHLIVRSDRIEPAKAIGDGLEAFEQLLADRADLHGTVTQLVRATASREDVEEYQQERQRLEDRIALINARFGSSSWTPIEFVVEDDISGSFAAFRRYDTLLITSHADGMNLVAREGPLLNERDGVLVLSRGAGAADAYDDDGALLVESGDVASIRRALESAIDMPAEQRTRMAAAARVRAPGTPPAEWLEQQRALAIAGRDARLGSSG